MSRLVEKDANRTVEEDNIVPPPMYDENGPPQIVTADTARQAPLGTPVLWVLVAACVLAAVGMLGAWIYVNRRRLNPRFRGKARTGAFPLSRKGSRRATAQMLSARQTFGGVSGICSDIAAASPPCPGERVDHGDHGRGRRADRAQFADALGAQRIGAAGHVRSELVLEILRRDRRAASRNP